ncbi:MAG: glutamate synthase subunit beta [Epsilonproteobacteria bacterium]|nr:glutamate synthase subunit beta [Campylobacterota bacterium]PIP10451.1 MAG: glutamate synthase small subunit [Sulfurimonas sp. CG23_combo_of_CG06-09_8_20_14_all_36_33]PIS26666.1 MAG: glutamate synthase small subunit [Sulfurimonas sp. CG08_land_8_20_14_0_20_36_33]PIU33477.1 MAG: glutamate synthase small subunit [Sulfurimonas sp. CG07_land_8_20_14_0_80_36_56]PIV04921.1 MAG: glutamate synthase small subunit [Sulfurimonas sp. CG03_land_8_20_14_0_80_36_25]PIV35178.1 MAG: glutamate synthase small
MREFLTTERIEPTKRLVVERTKDFGEIYEVFNHYDAATQSDRCVQCGDPFCLNKCPLHNYIPQWLKSIAEKDLEFAFKLSNEPSPFPEVMGRVCPHDRLCEGDCTLNDGHGAITIGSIETHITDEGFRQGLKPDFPGITTDKKVAVIGSGPAGLSAATYLLRSGIAVTMYEKSDRAGGLLTYGIPNFKLDKKIVERRVKLLEEAGLKLVLNCEVGKDIAFEDIASEHDAMFIGVGATKSKSAGISGEKASNVYAAIDYLTNIQRKNFKLSYEKKFDFKDLNVVVIGGGDTAMDCLRTAKREGAKSVTCLYRRDAHNMPGSQKEYKNAMEEGVDFTFFASPKEIVLSEDGKAIAVEVVKTNLGVKDESGRQKMEEVKGSEFRVKADVIIMSLGFDPAVPSFLAENGIETNSWGGIITNAETKETTTAGIYAGGDCFRGADLVVTAAFDGREAARNISKSILG